MAECSGGPILGLRCPKKPGTGRFKGGDGFKLPKISLPKIKFGGGEKNKGVPPKEDKGRPPQMPKIETPKAGFKVERKFDKPKKYMYLPEFEDVVEKNTTPGSVKKTPTPAVKKVPKNKPYYNVVKRPSAQSSKTSTTKANSKTTKEPDRTEIVKSRKFSGYKKVEL